MTFDPNAVEESEIDEEKDRQRVMTSMDETIKNMRKSSSVGKKNIVRVKCPFCLSVLKDKRGLSLHLTKTVHGEWGKDLKRIIELVDTFDQFFKNFSAINGTINDTVKEIDAVINVAIEKGGVGDVANFQNSKLWEKINKFKGFSEILKNLFKKN